MYIALLLFAWLAQHSPKHVLVEKTDSRIAVDGLLNEDVWQRISPIGEIAQREPMEGVPATENTDVKLLFDADNLYIGVSCYDSSPDSIIATQMSRDADLSVDDRVEILLDTFHDRRNAYYFATNPVGALVDGLIVENGQINRDWDAIWDVRTRRTEQGWSAEFAIPFKSLNFDNTGGIWGFNFARSIKRKLEDVRWAAPRLDVRFSQVSEAGEIEGLTDVEQGQGLDVRPYISGSAAHSAATAKTKTERDAGTDFFYNITPSLKLTGSINTDFAETEVDNRQINLTRFPTFFPEKRAFFLENGGVFNFATGGSGPAAGSGSELIPFFSRRIGLLGGTEIPILAGLKLTGKAGRYDVGILDMRTRESEAAEAKNFFVARVKRNILSQSYVGGIYTEGDPANPKSAQTYGTDMRLATSRFLGGRRNFELSAYGAKANNEGVEGENGSYGIAVGYPNDLWAIQGDWRKIERNFKPALGFVPRTDISRLNVSVDFAPRPRNLIGIRRMLHEFRYTRFVRLDKSEVESWRLFFAPVNYSWNSGDRLELNWNPQFERLFEPFEISRGVVLPPGDYQFIRKRVEFYTSNRRPWKVETTWWFGSYWSGHADQLIGTLQYKVGAHLEASFRYDQTFAKLQEGNFAARIFSLRLNYSVTPFFTISNLAQYDNDSKNLGWQSRIRWILRPGREIFLVFNQGWIREADASRQIQYRAADRGVAAKMQYTFRF